MSWSGALEWGLQTGLMVSALIMFVLLIRKSFAKAFGARAAYGLWALPIIRMCLPTLTLPSIALPSLFKPAPQPIAQDTLAVPFLGTPETAFATETAIDWLMLLTPVMIAVWALGTIAFIAFHARAQSRLRRRMLSASSLPSATLIKLAGETSRQIGFKRAPKICLNPSANGPMVSHLFPPIIYLPQDFETCFSPEQQRYALLHEMAHIRRGDLWAAWGWLIFRAINWPNPLVHWANRHFRSDQEAACDATVLSLTDGGRQTYKAYAETLLRAAEAVAKPGRASPVNSGLMLTIHQPLKERLIMLTREKTRPNWLIRSCATALVIAAFGITAPLTMAENHPDKEHTEKRVERSVIKRVLQTDGKTVKRHIEVTVDGDNVMAFEIDEDGNKTSIDADDLKDFDVEVLSEDIRGEVRILTRENIDGWRDGAFKDWKEGEFKNWAEDFEANARTVTTEGGKQIFVMPSSPRPPMPPGLTDLEDQLVIMKNRDGFLYNFRGEEAKLQSATSMLEAASDMIDDMDVDGAKGRKLAKVRRDLERARKSLEEAQAELNDRE